MIGDGKTAALVCRDGSIDWLCLPRLDSDACLAALLGTLENGSWRIAPAKPSGVQRHYRPDTLVLETQHTADTSSVRVPDFMPMRAPGSAISGAIAAVERMLLEDGLVRRKSREGSNPEGIFIACTFWLADCQNMQGRHDAARQTLERVLAIPNDLGLLSEEYDVPGKHLSGNFPQALSHLALVITALGLCGPVLQRGGG